MSRLPIQYVKYVLRRFVLHSPYLTAPAPRYGLTLRVKTEDAIGRGIYKHGVHEPLLSSFVCGQLRYRPGDLVFDVGANVGWYALLLNDVVPEGCEIFAFEPDPRNFALLEENVVRNHADKVRPQALGVADRSGKLCLHLYSNRNLGRHSMLPLYEGPTVDVDVVTLDDFCASHGLEDRSVRLLKVDVEGFEPAVLRGASRLLARCETVAMEFSPTYLSAAGLDPAALLRWMSERGFRAREFREGRLVAADLEALGAGSRHTDLVWQR